MSCDIRRNHLTRVNAIDGVNARSNDLYKIKLVSCE